MAGNVHTKPGRVTGEIYTCNRIDDVNAEGVVTRTRPGEAIRTRLLLKDKMKNENWMAGCNHAHPGGFQYPLATDPRPSRNGLRISIANLVPGAAGSDVSGHGQAAQRGAVWFLGNGQPALSMKAAGLPMRAAKQRAWEGQRHAGSSKHVKNFK